MVKTPHPPGRL